MQDYKSPAGCLFLFPHSLLLFCLLKSHTAFSNVQEQKTLKAMERLTASGELTTLIALEYYYESNYEPYYLFPFEGKGLLEA